MRRYLVVLILFVLSLITYIDRVAISSAKGPLAQELALSDEAMGAVFSAFALGYALAQVPAGWFADRFGPRLTLALAVSAWSIFTALTGAASNLSFLLGCGFCSGSPRPPPFPPRRARFSTGCRCASAAAPTASFSRARAWGPRWRFPPWPGC